MKVIQPGSGSYYNLFNKLKLEQNTIVAWQINHVTKVRVILDTTINFFSESNKTINCTLDKGPALDQSLALFFYAESLQAIFKCTIVEIQEGNFSVFYPPEIKLLDEPEVETTKRGLGVEISTKWRTKRYSKTKADTYTSLIIPKPMKDRSSRDQKFLTTELELKAFQEEQDKLYESQRQTKRARPPQEKMVKLIAEGGAEAQTLRLFDLSQGGMSFLSVFLDDFPKLSEIQIIGFDGFDLDDPLYGVIMSHEQTNGSGLEFKVGVKFLEGQG